MSTLRDQRAEFLDWLEATSKRIEVTAERAKDPTTPEAKQLGVRAGRRAFEKLWKKLNDLRQLGEPEPYRTAPTRERQAAAGEPMSQAIVYEAGQPAAISHRIVWPVQRIHQLHITNARQYHAAARFRSADERREQTAGTASYGDAGRASDPSRRLPISPDQEIAGREFRFVWARLEDELKALAWILILQRHLPGDAEPLSPVAVGKRFGNTSNEAAARWFAYGMIKVLCIRLSSIYAIYDSQRAKEQEAAAQRTQEQLQLHQRRVPLTRLRETA